MLLSDLVAQYQFADFVSVDHRAQLQGAEVEDLEHRPQRHEKQHELFILDTLVQILHLNHAKQNQLGEVQKLGDLAVGGCSLVRLMVHKFLELVEEEGE